MPQAVDLVFGTGGRFRHPPARVVLLYCVLKGEEQEDRAAHVARLATRDAVVPPPPERGLGWQA
jgi:hypothetical protein